MNLIYSTKISLFFNILTHFLQFGTGLEMLSRNKLGSFIRSHSRTAISASSLLWKQHLGGSRFHKIEEVGMDVYDLLQMLQPYFYGDGVFDLMPIWDICIDVFGNYVEK
jgi:hypothetical protein